MWVALRIVGVHFVGSLTSVSLFPPTRDTVPPEASLSRPRNASFVLNLDGGPILSGRVSSRKQTQKGASEVAHWAAQFACVVEQNLPTSLRQ